MRIKEAMDETGGKIEEDEVRWGAYRNLRGGDQQKNIPSRVVGTFFRGN